MPYTTVLHLNDLSDSTGNGNTGVNGGTTVVPGVVGPARFFGGLADIFIPASPDLDTAAVFSIEIVCAYFPGSPMMARLINRIVGPANKIDVFLDDGTMPVSGLHIHVDMPTGTFGFFTPVPVLSVSTTHYIVMRFPGPPGLLELFIDGVPTPVLPEPPGLVAGTPSLYLGSDSTTDFLIGVIEEFRWRQLDVVSTDEIDSNTNNIFNQTQFIDIKPVPDLLPGPDVDSVTTVNRSLELWLDAAVDVTTFGSKVTDWQSRALFQNILSQTNDPLRPLFLASDINSLPTVKFQNSLSNRLEGGDILNMQGETGITIFVVLKGLFQASEGTIFGRPNTGNIAYRLYFKGSSGGNVLGFSISDSASTTVVRDSSFGLTPSPIVITAKFCGGTEQSIYINGLLADGPISGAIPPAVFNAGGPTFDIGGIAGSFVTANIAELLIYRRCLTVPEQADVETFLIDKYITLVTNPGTLEWVEDFEHAPITSPGTLEWTEDFESPAITDPGTLEWLENFATLVFSNPGTLQFTEDWEPIAVTDPGMLEWLEDFAFLAFSNPGTLQFLEDWESPGFSSPGTLQFLEDWEPAATTDPGSLEWLEDFAFAGFSNPGTLQFLEAWEALPVSDPGSLEWTEDFSTLAFSSPGTLQYTEDWEQLPITDPGSLEWTETFSVAAFVDLVIQYTESWEPLPVTEPGTLEWTEDFSTPAITDPGTLEWSDPYGIPAFSNPGTLQFTEDWEPFPVGDPGSLEWTETFSVLAFSSPGTLQFTEDWEPLPVSDPGSLEWTETFSIAAFSSPGTLQFLEDWEQLPISDPGTLEWTETFSTPAFSSPGTIQYTEDWEQKVIDDPGSLEWTETFATPAITDPGTLDSVDGWVEDFAVPAFSSPGTLQFTEDWE